jgi:hypothetical protein
MDMILNFWHWLVLHPYWAVPILMVEFAVSYWLYYKSGENKLVKLILGIWFQPQNFIVNATAFTIIGLEPPRETAITKRMKRWKKLEPNSKRNRWRLKVAHWICDFTNKWDPGHC